MHELVQVLHTFGLVVLAVIGFFVAMRLNSSFPCWVRWIALSPALAALFNLVRIIGGDYEAYPSDVFHVISECLIYAIFSAHFRGKRWGVDRG